MRNKLLGNGYRVNYSRNINYFLTLSVDFKQIDTNKNKTYTLEFLKVLYNIKLYNIFFMKYIITLFDVLLI